MDWNQLEGNWKQMKGKVKEQWGKAVRVRASLTSKSFRAPLRQANHDDSQIHAI